MKTVGFEIGNQLIGVMGGDAIMGEVMKTAEPTPRLIDADELLNRIDKVAKKLNNNDTINGLCGAVAIIYDMLIETGQEKGKAESDEQEKVDDYRDRLDELEREEYYESKYGKEQE